MVLPVLIVKVHIFWEGHKIFAKFSPNFWLQYIRSKVRGRFRKILWPSQNIWTLLRHNRVPPCLGNDRRKSLGLVSVKLLPSVSDLSWKVRLNKLKLPWANSHCGDSLIKIKAPVMAKIGIRWIIIWYHKPLMRLNGINAIIFPSSNAAKTKFPAIIDLWESCICYF